MALAGLILPDPQSICQGVVREVILELLDKLLETWPCHWVCREIIMEVPVLPIWGIVINYKFASMGLKILKAASIISLLLISFSTGHIGGTYFMFLILGLISGGHNTLISILYLIILSLLIISILKSFKNRKTDLYLFLIGGLALTIPISQHIYFLIERNRADTMFYVTATIFLIIYGITLFMIGKKRET